MIIFGSFYLLYKIEHGADFRPQISRVGFIPDFSTWAKLLFHCTPKQVSARAISRHAPATKVMSKLP